MIRDVRGSVMGLATAGARVRTYRYGVWGEQTVEAPSSTWAAYDTHMGFTGHVVHRPSGLVFAPARVYAPRLRQWLTRDPAGERDSVDGRNLYAGPARSALVAVRVGVGDGIVVGATASRCPTLFPHRRRTAPRRLRGFVRPRLREAPDAPSSTATSPRIAPTDQAQTLTPLFGASYASGRPKSTLS
jgi:RHS repeat-associated protein